MCLNPCLICIRILALLIMANLICTAKSASSWSRMFLQVLFESPKDTQLYKIFCKATRCYMPSIYVTSFSPAQPILPHPGDTNLGRSPDLPWIFGAPPLMHTVLGCSVAGTVNVIVQYMGDQGTGRVLFIQVQGMDIESLLTSGTLCVSFFGLYELYRVKKLWKLWKLTSNLQSAKSAHQGCYKKVLKYQKAVKNYKTMYCLTLGSDNFFTFWLYYLKK